MEGIRDRLYTESDTAEGMHAIQSKCMLYLYVNVALYADLFRNGGRGVEKRKEKCVNKYINDEYVSVAFDSSISQLSIHSQVYHLSAYTFCIILNERMGANE